MRRVVVILCAGPRSAVPCHWRRSPRRTRVGRASRPRRGVGRSRAAAARLRHGGVRQRRDPLRGQPRHAVAGQRQPEGRQPVRRGLLPVTSAGH